MLQHLELRFCIAHSISSGEGEYIVPPAHHILTSYIKIEIKEQLVGQVKMA
jgi:hypothetical protein